MLFCGGMPSSHSALVIINNIHRTILSTHCVEFAISLVLAIIVIHDSFNIRYEVSKHARELNLIKLRLNLIENNS